MYAVIETGGKQYRVELGSELAVERLDAAPGETISFDRVLLVADGESAQVGTPVVDAALVTADVLRQDRGDKVVVFKYRPKARHRAKKGHRQEQTVLRISDIRFNGRSAADEAGAQEREASKARKAAAEEAERKAAADQALAARLASEAQSAAPANEEPADDTALEKRRTKRRTATTKTTAKATNTTSVEAAASGEPDAGETAADAAPLEEAPEAETGKAPRRARSTRAKKDE